MPSPERPIEPYDPDVLAAQAVDEELSATARKVAFGALEDLIRRLAISLSIRFTGRVRDDFTEVAAGEVYIRLDGYKHGVSFAGWCYRTLHNWMVDELRKEARRQEHEHEAARRRPEISVAIPIAESLSPSELEAISKWPSGHRLSLMCLTGLWRAVPSEVWRLWCDEHTSSGKQVLTHPFPPEEFETCTDQQERADILAQLLGVRRGTLAVWVHRCASRLRELRGT